jgi:hypothetical protein
VFNANNWMMPYGNGPQGGFVTTDPVPPGGMPGGGAMPRPFQPFNGGGGNGIGSLLQRNPMQQPWQGGMGGNGLQGGWNRWGGGWPGWRGPMVHPLLQQQQGPVMNGGGMTLAQLMNR